MPRSPIPTLIEQFHQMTPEEQKVFLDLVDPQPELEPATKQTRKKRSRSPRAQSLSNAIQRNTTKPSDTQVITKDDSDEDLTERSGLCGICGNNANYQDHFQPSPNYHEFEAPKVKKASGK